MTTRIVSQGEQIARANDSDTHYLRGDTYRVKDQLKKLGAKWNAAQKAWEVRRDVAQQAYDLLYGPLPQ